MAMIGVGIGDELARFHPELALLGAVIGLLVGLVCVATGFARPLALAGVVVPAVLWREVTVAGVVAAAVAIGCVVVASIVRREDSTLVGPLVVISLAGVWLAVPDTESALIALAVVTVALVVTTVVGRSLPPTAWGERLVGMALVVLVARAGSVGRSDLAGGIACLGALVAPVPDPHRSTRAACRTSLAVHTVAVLVASRVLTRWSSRAAIVGAVALLAIVAVLGVVSSRRGAPGSAGPERP
ncbi:MAG: hypothetical protein U0Q22_02165 [Acidimicrobiales bacterium]